MEEQKPKLKIRIFNMYYTAQCGFNALGWLLSVVAYTSIVVLAVHFIIPNLPSFYISMVTPILGFFFFLLIGHIFLKKGGYAQQAAFGGRQNPNRLNWELELKKANVSIAQCLLLMEMGGQKGIDTTPLKETIEQMHDIKESMEKLLGYRD